MTNTENTIGGFDMSHVDDESTENSISENELSNSTVEKFDKEIDEQEHPEDPEKDWSIESSDLSRLLSIQFISEEDKEEYVWTFSANEINSITQQMTQIRIECHDQVYVIPVTDHHKSRRIVNELISAWDQARVKSEGGHIGGIFG